MKTIENKMPFCKPVSRWARLRVLAFAILQPACVCLVKTVLAQSTYEPYAFTTLAGNAGYGSADGTGNDARFWNPSSVAVDSAGNVYVADSFNATIRKVTPAGVVTTLAGLAENPGSADGTGSEAWFNQPFGVAVDSAGNVYVADTFNNTIRKVTPTGVVTTLVGLAQLDQFGNSVAGSADGTGSDAQFNQPSGVAVDSEGNVYVADFGNHTIRKVTSAGVVTTLAGLAGNGGSADGTGSAARFYDPRGVAVDSAGNVYVADTGNNTIRKVTPTGVVTTLAGLAAQFDSAGNVMAGGVGSADGTGSAARFYDPRGVAVDSTGNVYVADSFNATIRKVTPAGVVTTLAGLAGISGSADGTGSDARFGEFVFSPSGPFRSGPAGVAVDSAGNFYVADTANNTIRKGLPPVGPPVILFQPQSQTVEGTYQANFSAWVAGALPVAYQWRKDGVDLAGATNTSYSIANVRTTDAGVYSVASTNVLGGVISSNATLTVFVRPPLINTQPQSQTVATSYNLTLGAAADGTPSLAYQWRKNGVDIAGGTNQSYSIANIQNHDAGLYSVVVSNAYGSVISSDAELSVTVAYTFTTLAGSAGSGSADGTGSGARFAHPHGLAVDSEGNVYLADVGNHAIRKVTAAGVVTTLAGQAGNPGSVDGTGSAARFNQPSGLAVDSEGNVHVADFGNHTIRKVTAAGVVTTLAGLAGSYGSADGTGSAARFAFPHGVAVDSVRNVYVADTANNTIRKMTPAGVVTTLAGSADSFGSADGTGGAARFNGPFGLAVDSDSNVYVADTGNFTIRKVTPVGTNWLVTTLGGGVGILGSADGTGSAARFSNPIGVAVDSAGNIYVADSYFSTIRKGYPENVPAFIATSGPGFGFNGGQFGFNLTGPSGRLVVVEASADLVSWLPIWTNTFSGALNFSDPQSDVYSSRFYRARLP